MNGSSKTLMGLAFRERLSVSGFSRNALGGASFDWPVLQDPLIDVGEVRRARRLQKRGRRIVGPDPAMVQNDDPVRGADLVNEMRRP